MIDEIHHTLILKLNLKITIAEKNTMYGQGVEANKSKLTYM